MPPVWDAAQAAWAEYVAAHYLDRYTIDAAHRAFMAGWAAAQAEHDEQERRH